GGKRASRGSFPHLLDRPRALGRPSALALGFRAPLRQSARYCDQLIGALEVGLVVAGGVVREIGSHGRLRTSARITLAVCCPYLFNRARFDLAGDAARCRRSCPFRRVERTTAGATAARHASTLQFCKLRAGDRPAAE